LIWYGDGFTRPENLVLHQPFMDLRPYVHGLPQEMAPYQTLFESFGIEQACFLPSVLRTIKQKYDEVRANGQGMSRTFRSSANEAEVKRDLHICVCILNELKSHVHDSNWGDVCSQLFLPIHTSDPSTLKLEHITQCTYTDDDSLRQGHTSGDLVQPPGSGRRSSSSTSSGDDSLTLVHANVPGSTLEALGVPTLLSRMLEAEELDYSFGQTDSLTVRLNALLQEYTDGFAVPKEMVQNADDAGATEVKFLYDERSNSDALTGLID